jgi:hypothetical protein
MELHSVSAATSRLKTACFEDPMFTFLVLLVCGYVIYTTGFDPSFGSFPPITIVLLLVIGVGADTLWCRF